jgi:hypothetical protein
LTLLLNEAAALLDELAEKAGETIPAAAGTDGRQGKTDRPLEEKRGEAGMTLVGGVDSDH